MPDEWLDVIDQDDLVIEQTLRSKVHQLGWWHRGVHVFLFTQDGKLLIQRRSKDRAQYPSAWDCSVSEHVKAGESYYDAAVRGMNEELGLTGIMITPVVKFKMNYGPNDNEVSTLYRGGVDPLKVKFDPVEIEKIDYISRDQLQIRMDRMNEAFCNWFLQMIRWSLGQDSELEILEVHSPEQLWTG